VAHTPGTRLPATLGYGIEIIERRLARKIGLG
jgi:hypothetical protein